MQVNWRFRNAEDEDNVRFRLWEKNLSSSNYWIQELRTALEEFVQDTVEDGLLEPVDSGLVFGIFNHYTDKKRTETEKKLLLRALGDIFSRFRYSFMIVLENSNIVVKNRNIVLENSNIVLRISFETPLKLL